MGNTFTTQQESVVPTSTPSSKPGPLAAVEAPVLSFTVDEFVFAYLQGVRTKSMFHNTGRPFLEDAVYHPPWVGTTAEDMYDEMIGVGISPLRWCQANLPELMLKDSFITRVAPIEDEEPNLNYKGLSFSHWSFLETLNEADIELRSVIPSAHPTVGRPIPDRFALPQAWCVGMYKLAEMLDEMHNAGITPYQVMTKLIAVIGVTGNQGGSVARAFLNEPEWKVRGITRDTSKPSATELSSQGVEVVAGNLDDLESLKNGFKGANVIFGNTDFWGHLNDPATHKLAAEQKRTANEVAYDREVAQAKAIIDAAAAHAGTLDRLVLSTLSEARKWSNGTIKWNLHFDAKAETENYLKETYPELSAKTSLLHLGSYASNWRPEKQEDGSFVLSLPMSGDRKIPMVDPVADTGRFTKALVDLPPGTLLSGAGSFISLGEWCDIFGKVNNVKCVFKQIPREAIEEAMGPVYGPEIADMYEYFDKFGFEGGIPDVVFPWDLGIDVKYTSMEEYLKSENCSIVL
ncbi:uncharacterized protein J4E87_002978 [Alternaria ethzedia]|uniref:uncharacterized protein n=1 Tax=Alternaria ethzedia TaxID=181014 RepID=UPI0020C45C9F|nr:uncharacterized protein J4E87_002978 [Alternaria ethzedia]KAI4629791.1 hypothetical protein J4E87_002978 [Alternaria ethzedia]